MECCYTRPGHQGTPFVAMSRFFYECLHKPKRTKRNNHCAIGTLANLETFSHVFFKKQSLLLVVVSGSNQHVPGHMSCRDLSGHHPNMQAARALACYMLQLLTAQLSSQRFYLRPNHQLRWANEVCHEMFEDTVFSTFSGGSATFGLILLSGDDAPRGESFCGRSIPMALLTLLQICSKDHHRQL